MKKLCLLSFCVMLFSTIAFKMLGQTISGPTSATAGNNVNYSFYDDQIFGSPSWEVTNGSIITSSVSGLTYYVTVYWHSAGSQTLSFKNWGSVVAQLSVSVTCPKTIGVPNTTFTYASSCSDITITRNSNPPANLTWYWQTSSSGQSTSLGSGTTLSVADGGTYYLRTNSNLATGCWSTNSQATLEIPLNPSVTNGSNCGPGTVALYASAGSNSVRWYSVCSGGSVVNTGTSYSPTISSTTTYYASAYNSSTGVESKRIPVTATINTIPSPPSSASVSPASVCSSGSTSVILSATGAGAGESYVWYTAQTGGSPLGSTSQSVSSTTTFWAAKRTDATGCESSRISATVTVNPLPASYTVNGSGVYCASGSGLTVSLSGSQLNVNYQLKKNGANEGGTLSGTGGGLSWANKPAGTYTIEATNTNGSCLIVMSGQATITADPVSVGGTVASTAELGTGTLAPQGTLTLSGNTGAVLRWEFNNGSGWQTAPHATTTTYSYLKLPESRNIRAIVKSGVCAEAASSSVKLEVHNLAYSNTIQLTSDTGPSYQWYKAGNIISGATQQNYNVNDQGVYTVKLSGITKGVFYVYPTISNQAQKVNAVSATVILKAGVTDATSLYTLAPNELMQTIAYQDGLGRTFQNIGVGMSPTQTDVITASGFGKQGLTDSTYLPFVSTTRDGRYKKTAIRGTGNLYTTSDQYLFYQNTAKVVSDTKPYARTLYRNTPDAKPTEQGAPGTDWQPGNNHTVRGVMALNNATNYRVRYWNLADSTTTNYANNSVVVNITTDENGNNVQTYTDARGLTVLKQVYINESLEGVTTTWLETYYIYDEYGRIKYILPPKAMKILGTGSSLSAKDTLVAELIHKFTYDVRGRLIEKKVPGAAVEFVVYDQLDRAILTQGGNLRATNKWQFVKYDVFNRPVYSGIYTNSTQTTRLTVQALLDGLNYSTTPWYESEGTVVHGYTNSAFPTTGSVANIPLSVNYYDHYNFDRTGGDDYTYDVTHITGQEAARSVRTRGLATGSKRVVLDAAGNATTYWITNAVFYDTYDRPIQTQTNNHLHTGYTAATLDKTTVIYDFVKPLKTKTSHYQNASTVVHLEDRNDFDHAGRVLKTYRKINSSAEQLLAQYEYNALGQVVDKKLHDTGGSTFLQSVDYRYNIRGWLTSINNAELNVNGSNNDETNDYFGLELVYNTAASGLSNTLYYNGNVSAIKWKGAGMHYSGPLAENTDGQRSYKFAYDKSDRLKAATFAAKDNATTWNKQLNTLNETMTYDHNGNIKTLARNRNLRSNSGISVTSASETFDNLTYTYEKINASANENTDKMIKVEDAVTGTVGQIGFNNLVNTATEYSYNTDGSQTKDDNKGISSITYNMLGKPQVVNFTSGKKIEYVYDAAGSKLTMKTWQGATLLSTTNYSGSFVYEGAAPVLSFFGSPEGRVVKTGANFEYQYAIADHQGNTRVVFSSATPAPVAVTATMEAATNPDFQNYTNRVGFNLFDHTDAGTTFTYAQKLTGGNNSQVGVAKSYKVYAGDKVKIEAWAKYQNPSSTSSNINAFASALFAAFGVPAPAGGESGTISSALNIWGGLVVGGNGGNSAGPKAFVNIVVFDKNYKLLDAAWEAVDPAANQVGATPVIAHDYLMREYTAKEEGYVFMYVSNESPTLVDVYFDDVVMTHTKGNLIQYNEYYPFGLQTANSWTRENTTGNNFLGNGGTELNTTSNLYDLEYRNYDPILGRMNQIDPMATKYASLTPYNFSFNDPVTFNDPSGADPDYGITRYTYDDRVDHYRGEFYSGGSTSALAHYQGMRSSLTNWGYVQPYFGNGGHTITIDFGNLADGAYTFGFTNGNLSSFGTISNDVIAGMSVSFLRQVLGLDAYRPSPERQILLQSSSGDFAQRGADGGLVVPYTNISYSDYRAGQAKNGKEGLANQIWNHPLTRFLTGDAISLSLDVDAFIPWGLDIEPIGVIMPLRGRDAFNFYGYSDIGGGFGFDLSISGQFGKYYFLGNANDLTIDYFQGPRVEANIAVTLGLDAGLGLSYSPTRTGYGIIKASSSVGFGVPVPFPISGNVNGGYTHIWK